MCAITIRNDNALVAYETLRGIRAVTLDVDMSSVLCACNSCECVARAHSLVVCAVSLCDYKRPGKKYGRDECTDCWTAHSSRCRT